MTIFTGRLISSLVRALRGSTSRRRRSPALSDTYPGDFTGVPRIRYRPDMDGTPDPGEIVWTWVPFEEDFTQGKDRPVLVIAMDGKWALGLIMTSKDHDRDAAKEARFGRHWFDIGRGNWDAQHRSSEVRLDRIVRVNPRSMRREGSILAKEQFERVARAVKETNGW